MNAQHVPAWKRLGLKLKYANQVPTHTRADQVPNGDTEKRKFETSPSTTSGSDNGDHQLKRARLDGDLRKDTSEGDVDTSHGQSIANVTKRKKSVTFTPDTKVEDGDSAQTIQFWVPDVPGSTYQGVSDPSRMLWPMDPVEQPQQEIKPKRPKSRGEPNKPRKATAALSYLNQYNTHRSPWKFNKNHETWVLKNAFSTERIPREHDISLASYIHGLKSPAAKQRLVEQARKKCQLGQNSDDNDVVLRQKLLQAIDASNTNAEGGGIHYSWLGDLSRAKLLLLSLSETIQHPVKQVEIHNRPLQRVKKNKSRTSRVDLESSSSSDSESEDEDSIASDTHPEPQNLAVRQKEKDSIDTDTSSDTSTNSDSSNTESDGHSEA